MLSARVPDRRVGKMPQVSHPASPSYTDPGPQKPQKLGIGVAKKKKTPALFCAANKLSVGLSGQPPSRTLINSEVQPDDALASLLCTCHRKRKPLGETRARSSQ